MIKNFWSDQSHKIQETTLIFRGQNMFKPLDQEDFKN